MMRLLRILILLTTCTWASAQAPKLRFTHLSNEQGLSNSTVECIFQDSRGFIWIGTRDGLDRYDGHEIIVYRNDPSDSTSLSDNYIKCMYEDRDHRLWVGTTNGLNRFDPSVNRFTRVRFRGSNYITALEGDAKGALWVAMAGGGISQWVPGKEELTGLAGLSDPRVNTIFLDHTGRLWAGTQSSLEKYENGMFTSYHNSAATNPTGNNITAIKEDRQGNLWLGTEDDGLALFDPANNSFRRLAHIDRDAGSLGSNMVRSILIDKSGRIWAGGINGGLNLYDPVSNKFSRYEYLPGDYSSLSQRTVSALFEDRQHNIWVGTHRGGVNIYSPGMEKFHLYRQEPGNGGLTYNDVKSFCEDGGNIWIGTDGGGLDLFQRDNNSFTAYRYDPYNPNSLGSDAVLDIMRDRAGNIWVSTWGGGLNKLDKRSGRFTRYQNRPGDSSSISSNFVQKTFEDYQGRIWAATYFGGLNILDPATGRFSRLLSDPTGATHLQGKNIVSLLEDREGQIWIGTDDGGLNCWQPNAHRFVHYFDKGGRMPDIRVLFTDSRGRLWVGQRGLYLFDTAKGDFRLYTDKAGLSNEFIKGMTEDEAGNFWIASSNGLTQFDPESYHFTRYNTGDGLQGQEFEANASLKTRDGEMYFGGVNGFNRFYAAGIRTNPYIPPVYITGFQVFNQQVNPGVQGSPLQKDISYTPEIVLSYKQATFSFNFAALNYTTPENNRYAYKMEGLEKEWNYVGKERRSVYTNLAPGSYTFHVKGSNNDGVWNETGASVKIVITPPFWRTDWFITLLVLAAGGFLYWLYKYRTRLKLHELEERKREEMHQMQLQFFTNVSHEFRTPLTLILGPLERLMKESVSPAVSQHYASMYRNAQRLLSLINELMDFGKIESGALKLSVMKSNLAAFLDEMAEEFSDWARQKQIDFVVRYPSALPGMWFDRQILEKIVLNLLNNAFKYTKNGGTITLEAFESMDGFTPSFENELVISNEYRGKSYIYIRVADTGIGISKDSIGHVFERYYRITDSHLGSGVGLAFVKSLALLHKGDIWVYSQRHQGTEIIIGLPVGETDHPVIETPVVRLEGFEATVTDRILLVEDNEELRQFIKDTLSPYYQIFEAADGKQGLASARELLPDLIISDIVMPGMNGIEFCKTIKQDIDTSHIPFIMLTARSTIAAQLQGLDSGADYYFAKPLNMDLLLLTIRNRFEQSERLKQRYTRDGHIEAMELVHTEKDKEFMTRLLAVIDSQLVNPDFDIEWLCGEMGMSRTKLYQKIKNISQQSIGDFIRTIRLKKAVQIMTHEDVSLTEVMYRIGIQTQSYFSKAFKKEFGKTPTQFMQEIKKY